MFLPTLSRGETKRGFRFHSEARVLIGAAVQNSGDNPMSVTEIHVGFACQMNTKCNLILFISHDC